MCLFLFFFSFSRGSFLLPILFLVLYLPLSLCQPSSFDHVDRQVVRRPPREREVEDHSPSESFQSLENRYSNDYTLSDTLC